MKTFWKILLALLALRLVLMAVVPVFEPSEARYAAISANMARTGDFVVPRFTYDCEYQSFDGKPPLVFQAGGLGVLGALCLMPGAEGVGNPYALQFAVRLFPLLSAMLLLAILFRTLKREASREAAALAVLMTATSTAFFAAAGMSMTDMTLTLCVAGALLLYKDFADTSRFRDAAGVAALLGLGMIVKGPVALALFGLPVLADAIVNRRWKALFTVKWLAVAPIFFVIAVPWFVLIEQRNPGAVWYFFYNENFMRFISHDYGDKYGAGREAFRGVAILWAIVACLPWSLRPFFSRQKPQHKNFFFLASVTITLFWCLTSRVLLYYLFPMIPLFMAYVAETGDRATLKRLAPWCAGISAVVVTVALVGGMFFSDKMLGTKTPFSVTENHYANEFYHGTKPAEEIRRLKAEYEAKQAAEMAKWMEWRRQREEAQRKARGEGHEKVEKRGGGGQRNLNPLNSLNSSEK